MQTWFPCVDTEIHSAPTDRSSEAAGLATNESARSKFYLALSRAAWTASSEKE